MDQTQKEMHKAFDLVCPRAHALKLAAHGLIAQASAEQVSWKGRISCLVTLDDLKAADVTIAQVQDSIEFMTATTARVEFCKVHGKAWERYSKPRDGFLIQAPGYAAGPAGDH